MDMAHGPNSIDVCAVDSADAGVFRWERLQKPGGRMVRLAEHLVRQECQVGPLEAGGIDDHVPSDEDPASWTSFWYTLLTSVHVDSVLREFLWITTQPLCLPSTDLFKDIVVAHGCACKKTFFGGSEILEIAVEETPQQIFRDPR